MPNVYVLHFGADPSLFYPKQIQQDIDVGFYGYGLFKRKDIVRNMIVEPSKLLPHFSFVLHLTSPEMNLGLAKVRKKLVLSSIKSFCCRSKINLNITHETFAKTYASSTARIFELASMECCIVSNPCNGIEEWFEPGKELFIADDLEEAVELYKWLIPADELRHKVGIAARKRVLEEHTYRHRAEDFIKILKRTC